MSDVREEQGKLAWDTYKEAVGGVSFEDKPLPDWDDLGERQREGWRAAAEAVAEDTGGDMG